MTKNEVWPNAPLALVAVEARFPAASSGSFRVPVHRALRDHLGTDWVIEGGKEQTVEFAFGAGGVQPPNLKVDDLARITVRDRTQAVTLRPESVSIEATRYDGYQAFRGLLGSVFEAVERVVQPDGLTRLGLRYIDEIRVPGLSDTDGWQEWLDDALIAPRAEGLTRLNWTSAAQYDTGTDRRLVLRYGPAESPVVDTTGPLRRPGRPGPGPVFVLDFDSFWQPSDIPAFSTPELLSACDGLRGPARALFDQLLTDRLIDDVFRKEPGQ